MNDNFKKFLEKVGADEVLAEKAKDIKDEAAVIEFAKSLGFEITAEDFKIGAEEMSLDELDVASGGKTCACAAGGGGKSGKIDKTCACVVAGSGMGKSKTDARCFCVVAGVGGSED